MKKIILGRMLIDGTGKKPLPRPAVVVEDGRIRSVQTSETLPHSHDAEMIDLSDTTLLPGFIDAHVHLVLSGDQEAIAQLRTDSDEMLTIRATHNAQRCLKAGVTTVRDCGDRNGVTLTLKRAIALGIVPGPRIVACGPPITTTAGHLHYMGIEADSAHEVRKAARRLIKLGVDWIKVCGTGGGITPGTNTRRAQYSVAELKPLVQDAHRLGRRVSVHAHGTEGIRNAVRAGADSIEHSSWLAEDDGWEYDEEIVAEIQRKGLVICHTIAGPRGIAEKEERKAREEGPQGVLSFQCRALRAGANVVLGTDAGIPDTQFEDFPKTLEVAVKLGGFSEMETIVCVTGRAAELLGWADEIGTVEAGKYADLVAVDGNLLEDIAALQSIVHVIQGGEIVR